MADQYHNLDLAYLFKLRLVIARLGELDNLAWWNTKGVLSPTGDFVYSRGLPRTHRWAQARLVFAVAAARCQEVFSARDTVTLWSMPASVEDAFEDKWQEWIDAGESWTPFFVQLNALKGADILQTLQDCGLLPAEVAAAARQLKLAAEGGSVPLANHRSLDDRSLTLLAAGFAHGERGKLAVPYLRLGS